MFALKLHVKDIDLMSKVSAWMLGGLVSSKLVENFMKHVEYIIFNDYGNRYIVAHYRAGRIAQLLREIRSSPFSFIGSHFAILFGKDTPVTELEVSLVHNFLQSYDLIISDTDINKILVNEQEIECTPLGVASLMCNSTRYGISLKIFSFQTALAVALINSIVKDSHVYINDACLACLGLLLDSRFLSRFSESMSTMQAHYAVWHPILGQFKNISLTQILHIINDLNEILKSNIRLEGNIHFELIHCWLNRLNDVIKRRVYKGGIISSIFFGRLQRILKALTSRCHHLPRLEKIVSPIILTEQANMLDLLLLISYYMKYAHEITLIPLVSNITIFTGMALINLWNTFKNLIDNHVFTKVNVNLDRPFIITDDLYYTISVLTGIIKQHIDSKSGIIIPLTLPGFSGGGAQFLSLFVVLNYLKEKYHAKILPI